VIGLTRLEIRTSSHAVVFAVPPIVAALIDVATAGTLAGATFGLIAAKRGGAVLVGFLCNAFWMLIELVPRKIQGVPTSAHLIFVGSVAVLYGLLSGPFAWSGATWARAIRLSFTKGAASELHEL